MTKRFLTDAEVLELVDNYAPILPMEFRRWLQLHDAIVRESALKPLVTLADLVEGEPPGEVVAYGIIAARLRVALALGKVSRVYA